MNARSPTTTAASAPRRRPTIVLLAGLALIGGCAVQRGVSLPPLTDWETREAVLREVAQWSFSGRIGVSAGSEGFNGRLRWRQDDDAFEASVSGPLGAGAVQIDSDGRRITVTENDGQITELADPEYDLRMRYGWTLPLTSLRYWALGIPDPHSPATVDFGDDGQLARLEQRNWVVDIGQYREGGGQLMPRRITAVSTDSRVRLVIDQWTFY